MSGRSLEVPGLSDRIRGAVLGAAVGDALGYPVEFIRSLDEIRARFGPAGVTGYVSYVESGARKHARYSDDTQLAELVLRVLVEGHAHETLDATMQKLASEFVRWARQPQGGHRAPGNACLEGCRQLERGVPWNQAGGENAGGCGSVMRAYPFGVMFVYDSERGEAWSVEHSKLTHRAPIALAACAAMARGTAASLLGLPLADTLAIMTDAAARHDRGTAEMLREAARISEREPPDSVLLRWQGWAAHEAIAAATYVYARHPSDPRAALLEAVNSPGDSDSIGTLVGALVGARAGIQALPAGWVSELERSRELLELADRAAECVVRPA